MICVTKRADTRPLDGRRLTYSAVGATAVADEIWSATPAEFRRHEQTVSVRGSWEDARSLMLRWAEKTRSGFDVDADGIAEVAVSEGANVWLRLAIGPVEVREPVRVVAVVVHPLRLPAEGAVRRTVDASVVPVAGDVTRSTVTYDRCLAAATFRPSQRPDLEAADVDLPADQALTAHPFIR
jgi:hypothetical protein